MSPLSPSSAPTKADSEIPVWFPVFAFNLVLDKNNEYGVKVMLKRARGF